MNFTDENTKKLLILAKLSANTQEVKALTSSCNEIFSYMEKLNELDVSSVKPMQHVHGSSNIYREDTPIESMNTDLGLQNAPNKAGDYISVPLIIEE